MSTVLLRLARTVETELDRYKPATQTVETELDRCKPVDRTVETEQNLWRPPWRPYLVEVRARVR